MNVLLMSRYGTLGSSSRLRAYQYIPELEARGITVCAAPLLDDTYLESLYSGNRCSLTTLAGYYLKRIGWLLQSRRFDLVWIEKELFPHLPAWGERFLSLLKKPYVVDYDDATFHNYDLSSNKVVRLFLAKKIDAVMRHASLVIVGNDYLAERALGAGAGRVEYLPTTIDLNRYRSADRPSDSPFTIGWIGSPSTAKYWCSLKPVFEEMCKSGTARLLAIGISDMGFDGIPVEYRSWSEDTEVDSLNECHVGIMPLNNGPWEKGKCGYKLIQYMACGLPVIASPVGVNRDIVEHGTTGYLANTTEEWVAALKLLQANPGLRSRMGEAGRRRVEERYCIQVTAARLAELIFSLLR